MIAGERAKMKKKIKNKNKQKIRSCRVKTKKASKNR